MNTSNFMKKLLKLSFALVLIYSFSNQVHADINFYGKINVSLEDVDSKDANETDFQNNASRIGVKGSYNFSPDVICLFRLP